MEEAAKITKIDFDPLSKQVVDAAFTIHQTLGSGMLESIVEKIMNAHTAQILSYMRIANIKTGLLINFGDPYFKSAIRRFVL